MKTKILFFLLLVSNICLAQKHYLQEEFIQTVPTNDYDKVKFYISKGVDVNYIDTIISLPIITLTDSLPIIQLLVDAGANINLEFNGMTPVAFFTKENNLDIVKYLLSKNANDKCKFSPDFTKNDNIMYNIKMALGIDIISLGWGSDNIDKLYITSILGIAIVYENLQIIKYLIEDYKIDDKTVMEIKKSYSESLQKYNATELSLMLNNLPIVAYLLNYNSDLESNIPDKDYNIIKFAQSNTESTMYKNMFLRNMTDINEKAWDFNWLLFAARDNNFEQTKYLLSKGIKTDLKSSDNYNALELAIFNKNITIAKYLILNNFLKTEEEFEELKKKDYVKNNLEITDFLENRNYLDLYYNFFTREEFFEYANKNKHTLNTLVGSKVFFNAIENNDTETIKLFLDANVIHEFIKKNEIIEITQITDTNEIKTNVINNYIYGRYILANNLTFDNFKIIFDKMLENNMSIQNYFGSIIAFANLQNIRYLYYKCPQFFNGNYLIYDYVRGYEETDTTNYTVKELAQKNSDKNVLNFINSPDNKIFQLIEYENYTAFTEHFENNDLDINEKNYEGKTPLHKAIEKNKLETVIFLIHNKCDINISDYNGRTPLMYAIMHNRNDIAQLLIKKKALVNQNDNFGNSNLDLTIYYNNKEIFDILQKKKAINGTTEKRFLPFTNSHDCNLLISNNEKYAILYNNKDSLKIFDLTDGSLQSIIVLNEASYNICISPDEKFVYTSDSKGIINVWELKTGILISAINVMNKNINNLKISANKKYLIVSYQNNYAAHTFNYREFDNNSHKIYNLHDYSLFLEFSDPTKIFVNIDINENNEIIALTYDFQCSPIVLQKYNLEKKIISTKQINNLWTCGNEMFLKGNCIYTTTNKEVREYVIMADFDEYENYRIAYSTSSEYYAVEIDTNKNIINNIYYLQGKDFIEFKGVTINDKIVFKTDIYKDRYFKNCFKLFFIDNQGKKTSYFDYNSTNYALDVSFNNSSENIYCYKGEYQTIEKINIRNNITEIIKLYR